MSQKYNSTYKLMNLDTSLELDKIIENLSGSNTTTLSMRIELFISEHNWKKSNTFSKEFLFTFICLFEERISKMILFWNENRVFLNEFVIKELKIAEYIENNPFYSLNRISSEKDSAYSDEKNFNLDKLEIIKNYDYLKSFKNETYIQYLTNLATKKEEIHYEKLYNESKSLSFLIEKKLISKNISILDKLGLSANSRIHSNFLPMYVISTRDCFVFDLEVKEDIIEFENRKIIKKEYFFDKNNFPSNFPKFKSSPEDYRVGIVTYQDFFSHEEICELENLTEKTEEFSLREVYLPETAQKTFSGEKLKRTKFFFGARYMWTKKQLAEPNSYVAAGVRKDVSPPPYWIKNKVEIPLINAGIILKDFVNSYALNVYHDGSEGLGQHFDDAIRFKQVIIKINLSLSIL